MAVIREQVIVAPSVDSILDETDMDSVTIEPGIYTVLDSKTIDSLTCNRWTVICLANEDALGPACYAQVWVPNDSSGVTVANQTMYIRTLASGGQAYGNFSTLVNKDYLVNNAVINKSAYPAELYAQTTQPAPVQGKTIIWIDTSV